MDKHRHQEWIKYLNLIDREAPPELDVHLIVDHCAARRQPMVKAWKKRNKRFHFHSIPTSSSWLGVIEGSFASLTQRRLKRDAFKSATQPEQAITQLKQCERSEPNSR